MKITFYKVLSYWREGKEADFDKLARYDSNLFELFKSKIETDERIVKSGSRDLFIFRKSSSIADFKGRPIELVVGMYAEMQFTDSGNMYSLIQEQVDVFDEKLEYVIGVDDSLLVSLSKIVKSAPSAKNKFVIGIVVILIMFSSAMYWYMSSPVKSKQNPKASSLVKENKLSIDNIPKKEHHRSRQIKMVGTPKIAKQKKKVHKQPKIKKVKWEKDTFCKTYEFKKTKYCYEVYIEEKCKKKNDFKISYNEYAKLRTDIKSCRFSVEDENLKEAMKENSSIPKQFFKGAKR